MKQQQIIDTGLRRLQQCDLGVKPALFEFALKSGVAIGSERVPTGETVTSQTLANGDRCLRIRLNQILTQATQFRSSLP